MLFRSLVASVKDKSFTQKNCEARTEVRTPCSSRFLRCCKQHNSSLVFMKGGVPMSNFKLKTLVLGPVQTNCYIISNDVSKEAIVFDIGDQADKVLSYLLENDLTCKAIILTHGHFDHILAVGDFAQRTGTLVYAHEAEEDLLMDPEKNSSARIRRPYSLKPDVLLKDNEELTFGELQIKVIHTPGHTGGGACYYMAELGILISGDTLFREDIGR